MLRKPRAQVIPLAEARELWRRALDAAGAGALPPEPIGVTEARGRITAAPVPATRSWPHYHAAAMDGIAVTAADSAGASETTPRRLRIARDAEIINTGDALPEGRDAVIKIEDVAIIADEVEITAAAAPWSNTRPAGEDVVMSEMILPAGHPIRPADVAALIAGGVSEVAVRRKPRVAVIPTGGEVVEPGAPLAPGQIVDFDSYLLEGLLAERGCEAVRWKIIPDDPNLLRDAVAQAARECDAVAVIAGASVGERDHTAAVLAELGKVIVHGVAMRPGKPVILGIIGKVPFIGVPGYPVSAVICFEQFVEPLIARWLGVAQPPERMCTAIMSRDVPSQAGSEEFVRVRLGEVNGRLIAVPLARGAGLITSLVRADAVLRIPALSEGLLEGEPAECALRVPEETLSSTLLIAGSHDLSLDLLDSMLRQSHEGRAVPQTARHILAPSTRRRAQMRVASIHVGSQAGLSALRGGYCHAAGTHLLDPDTGEYNIAYIRRLFAPGEVSLITVALRRQGLIVAPGNPLGLAAWGDLARPGLRFINRQRGAGTRVLLDYELRRAGVDVAAIEGYGRIVYTHLAVAAAVQSGAADVGVGIAAAARALDLGFVPLASERYELAVPTRSLDAQPVAALLEVLNTADFKNALHSLGGYDVSETAAVRAA